jgi:hypothetical protein
MAGAIRCGTVVLVALIALSGATVSAGAAIRYATPTPAPGASEPCNPNPCNIGQAIQGSGVQSGDTVLLLPGNYITPDGSSIVVVKNLTVAAESTRPTISSNGSGVFHVSDGGTGTGSSAALRDLNIVATNLPTGDTAERAVDLLDGSTAERLYVNATGGSGATAMQLNDGATVRDSVVWAHSPAAVGVMTGGSGGSLRNVTAVGDPGAGDGVFVSGVAGPNQTTTLRNVIASGLNDVHVTEGVAGDVTLVSDHSNYDTLTTSGTPDTAAETHRQLTSPLFVNSATGDFHQLAGSPTIDAGSADALDPPLGAHDIDGQARVQGSAPDIGADEFTPSPGGTTPPPENPTPAPEDPTPPPGGGTLDTTPPETTITKEPANRTTKHLARFRFRSSEPGSSFQCKLDRRPFRPCSSPFHKRVDLGRHRLKVRAIDAAGNVDPTPDRDRWRVFSFSLL